MKKIILAMAVILAGCTNAKETNRVLKMNGYTDIQITGHSWFSCGKGDWSSTEFIAKTPNNLEVEGTVCSGLLFKSSTIRF